MSDNTTCVNCGAKLSEGVYGVCNDKCKDELNAWVHKTYPEEPAPGPVSWCCICEGAGNPDGRCWGCQ